MIKARKRVETVISLDMDAKTAKQLDDWLLWAVVVWQQIQYHPMLQDEIFHDAEGTNKAPATKQLSHDMLILFRMRMLRAEVEEI